MKKIYFFIFSFVCSVCALAAMEEKELEAVPGQMLSKEEQAKYLELVKRKLENMETEEVICDNPPIDKELYLQDVLAQLDRIKKKEKKKIS